MQRTSVKAGRTQEDISLGSETAYKLEYDDLYSTPVGTQLDKIKNVKVARYLYSKSNVEDDLTSETLVYDGNNAIYYMTDACYGYKAIIEEAKSGQSIEIKSSGAYYVELAISGVSVATMGTVGQALRIEAIQFR